MKLVEGVIGFQKYTAEERYLSLMKDQFFKARTNPPEACLNTLHNGKANN
ncbi:MAG TPA: hypothetical protein VF677_00695 [Flavobacterium sp.]|jgi:hypothetical protein